MQMILHTPTNGERSTGLVGPPFLHIRPFICALKSHHRAESTDAAGLCVPVGLLDAISRLPVCLVAKNEPQTPGADATTHPSSSPACPAVLSTAGQKQATNSPLTPFVRPGGTAKSHTAAGGSWVSSEVMSEANNLSHSCNHTLESVSRSIKTCQQLPLATIFSEPIPPSSSTTRIRLLPPIVIASVPKVSATVWPWNSTTFLDLVILQVAQQRSTFLGQARVRR